MRTKHSKKRKSFRKRVIRIKNRKRVELEYAHPYNFVDKDEDFRF